MRKFTASVLGLVMAGSLTLVAVPAAQAGTRVTNDPSGTRITAADPGSRDNSVAPANKEW